MLVLALECATELASVSLVEDGVEVSAWRERTRQDLCRRLAPETGRVLEAGGRAAGDIGLVAVGRGPGSFTSMRVALATAKAFAAARSIPLVGVPSLQAMAWQMKDVVQGRLCPVLNAGRGQMYAAVYRSVRHSVEPAAEVFLATPEELAQQLHAQPEPVTVFGQMDAVPADVLQQALGERGSAIVAETVLPDALAVAQLGRHRYAQAGGDDIASLRPIYVRMSYAEERFDIDLGLR
jgi:tRNA threonylcarbamoyladenosine biosynthesis protein TsaB